jgi:hypothetical protein
MSLNGTNFVVKSLSFRLTWRNLMERSFDATRDNRRGGREANYEGMAL